MTNEVIVTRLKRIADHAVHIPGEKPFVMSLDDGIAIHEAIERLSQQTEDAISRPVWIPVSEKLPGPMGWDESYLVSLAWGGVGVMEYKSTGFHNYGSFSPVPIEAVTAWMPLPTPYKPQESEG